MLNNGFSRYLHTIIAAGCFVALGSAPVLAAGPSSIPITWAADVNVGSHPLRSLSEIPAMMKATWRTQGDKRVFPVHNKKGQTMTVSNCRSLFKADQKGMTMQTLMGRLIYRGWARTCFILRALAGAEHATQSYVSDFVLTAKSVKTLPVGVAYAISPSDFHDMHQVQAEGGDLGDYIAHHYGAYWGQAKIQVSHDDGQAYATITSGQHLQNVQSMGIVARADFNHDGVQDFLLSTYEGIKSATYKTLHLYVITRKGPQAPLRLIKNLHVMYPNSSYRDDRVPPKP